MSFFFYFVFASNAGSTPSSLSYYAAAVVVDVLLAVLDSCRYTIGAFDTVAIPHNLRSVALSSRRLLLLFLAGWCPPHLTANAQNEYAGFYVVL